MRVAADASLCAPARNVIVIIRSSSPSDNPGSVSSRSGSCYRRRSTELIHGGPTTSRNTWAPVREASRGPFVSRLGGGFGSSPCEGCLDFSSHFRDLPRLAALESRHDFDLSAVQISGLPGNDRPLTHTVTLRVARSFALARWRHSISSPRLIQRTPLSASAARYLIRSKLLPLAGAPLPDAAAGAALQI